jgi:hypothetical protein
MSASPPVRWLAAAAFGASGAALLSLLDGALEPAGGEPLALRWARAAADHPVRTAAAGACLFLALAPAARPGPPDRPLSEQDGGSSPC